MNTIPEGPTDPRLSAPPMEETITVSAPPGVGPPPGSPAGGPPGSPAGGPPGPPLPPPPPPPPTSLLNTEPAGRVYSARAGEGTGDDPVAGSRPGADRGSTTIADEVVERVINKIVDLTVDRVAGVHALHPGEEDGQPVTVGLDGERARISISIQVTFGHAVHEVVEQVRGDVVSEAERLLGLTVDEVNVLVADVTFDPAD